MSNDTKAGLPERLRLGKHYICTAEPSMAHDAAVAEVRDEVVCAELVRRYNAHEEMREALILARHYVNGDNPDANVYATIDKAIATHHP